MEAGVNIIGEFLYYGISKIFHVIFLPMLKISFSFKLEWLKILKDMFETTTQLWQLKLVIALSFLFILNLSYV